MTVQIGFFQYLFSIVLYYGFVLIGLGVFVHNSWELFSDRFKATFSDHENTFDFIVVGGGSAGAVVASRLSENFKTLLLEAGGTPHPLTYMPLAAVLMLNNPGIDWQQLTVPQNNSCLAMNQQRSLWTSGKGLGGSSNLNFMIYARGHPEDYDNWARELDSPRWAYKNVLKYFKKSENYKCSDTMDEETSKYHAKGGYLTVKYPYFKGMADYFVNAGNELGYPTIDYNGNFSEGFAVAQYIQQTSSFRMGTYSGFIQPLLKARKNNLFVYQFSTVNKILFEPGTKRVSGVEYTRHGKTKIAYANKEVIISAGAINSPKILMASGIGPKEHLEHLGIPVIQNLPVGKNLQDHVGTFTHFVVNDSVSFNPDRDLSAYSFLDWYFNGKGVLTSSSAHATAFLSSSRSKKEDAVAWPDLQLILLTTSFYQFFPRHLESAFNLKKGTLHEYTKEGKDKDTFMILNLLGRPKSIGEVLLSSTDPKDPPKVNPRYFEDESDMKALLEAIKHSVNLVENTTTFARVNGHLYPTPFPGCEKQEFKSDAYYECLARHYTTTIFHPSGTCSMGRENSKKAVVNSKLQVIGIENLRVADASVIPTLVSANTNAPCIMIAEMGADLIKKKYLQDTSQCIKPQPNFPYLKNEL